MRAILQREEELKMKEDAIKFLEQPQDVLIIKLKEAFTRALDYSTAVRLVYLPDQIKFNEKKAVFLSSTNEVNGFRTGDKIDLHQQPKWLVNGKFLKINLILALRIFPLAWAQDV